MTANTREDRELIIRDKAAREGFDVPQDVIDFLTGRFDTEQKLKSELINIAMFAAHRSISISLAVAKLVVDGERVRPLSTMTPEYEETVRTTEAEAETEAEPYAHYEESGLLSELSEPDAEPEYESPYDPPFSAEELNPAEEELNLFSFDTQPTGVLEPVTAEQPVTEQPPIAGLPIAGLPIAEPPVAQPPATEPTITEQPATTGQPKPSLDFGFGPTEFPREDSGFSSDVFFIPMRTQRKRSLLERIDLALTRSGIDDMIAEGDKVAIKVHFGEQGNTGFVSPLYARAVVDRVKNLGAKPFLTDTNTLYSGQRSNAIDHLNCAIAHGFGYSSVGAPLIIADGLVSRDSVEVPLIGGKHFSSVRIASAAMDADAMIVITHAKGHEEAGLGGALKNVGMGLGTRSSKQRMHSGIKPKINISACTACGRCIEWCAPQCIEMRRGTNGARHAFIHQEPCVGCGECLAACSYGAIDINWETSPQDFLEKTVEHAAGALNHFNGKVAFLNFLTNISPDCDCWGFSDAPIVPDIGILAARDAVAIDQATIDLISQAIGAAGSRGEGMQSGEEKFHALHEVDPSYALSYAEQLKLGTRNYRLRQVG